MSFSDFTEQQQVVKLLQQSLDRGRLSHAYLFTGSDIAELEAMGAALAKALNCKDSAKSSDGQTLDSCDSCSSCRRIGERVHPDVQFVRPESKSRVITIDQIRDLMQTIYLKPTEAKTKVAIIVSADRLNVQAANAFLKTLEEPPGNSILVLLSTEPQRILETIVSRCLRLSFEGEPLRRLNDVHGDWLRKFGGMAAAEKKGLFGRYRLLSLIISRLVELKAETEKALTDRSPLQHYDDVDPKLRDRWEDELAASIEAEYRRERSDVLLSLQWWFRDIWLMSQGCDRELMVFPSMEKDVETVARRLSPEDAVRNLETLETVQRLLGGNVQEALALEVTFLKLKL